VAVAAAFRPRPSSSFFVLSQKVEEDHFHVGVPKKGIRIPRAAPAGTVVSEGRRTA
jgi:hypothetical protein